MLPSFLKKFILWQYQTKKKYLMALCAASGLLVGSLAWRLIYKLDQPLDLFHILSLIAALCFASILLMTLLEIAHRYFNIPLSIEKAIRRTNSPTIRNLCREAQNRGLTIQAFGSHNYSGLYVFRSKEGGIFSAEHRYGKIYFSGNSEKAIDLALDKVKTKTFLTSVNIPTARHTILSAKSKKTESTIQEALSWGCAEYVVKPVDGGSGKDVLLEISGEDLKKTAYRHLKQYPMVMIEEFFRGQDVRIQVVGGKFFAAIERQRAFVVGNGTDSINKLVVQYNRDRLNVSHCYLLEFDRRTLRAIRKRGYTKSYIPTAGEKVILGNIPNICQGGVPVDVTDRIHPSVRQFSEDICARIGASICGIDILLKEIESPIAAEHACVVELNIPCGLAYFAMLKPKNKNIFSAIIDSHLYPDQYLQQRFDY